MYETQKKWPHATGRENFHHYHAFLHTVHSWPKSDGYRDENQVRKSVQKSN